ncbi:hypothetical protein [Streptomyces sp. NBRC 109706]|uniref:hypothetical protein n=1 Tax=Streptomyces sp. NBRC 109706 TaxID=1550035 RepID=UPI00078399EC|nr:hypothetical protein [Streptomyces sp. NBRC 109706]
MHDSGQHHEKNPDAVELALRAADPVGAAEPPAADGPLALRVLTRAGQRSRRHQRLRRTVLVGATTLAAVGATAGAYVWVNDPGQPHESQSVACVMGELDVSFGYQPSQQDPAEVCREYWIDYAGEPAPAELTACVDNTEYNPLRVFPGGAEICAEYNATPYTGVSEEQLRFSEFRRELQGRLSEAGCSSEDEAREWAEELLAEHRLDGWTVRAAEPGPDADAGQAPDAACAMMEYDEANREIGFARHDLYPELPAVESGEGPSVELPSLP